MDDAATAGSAVTPCFNQKTALGLLGISSDGVRAAGQGAWRLGLMALLHEQCFFKSCFRVKFFFLASDHFCDQSVVLLLKKI